MAYKHFILKNRLPDNIENYTKYQEQYGEIYNMLGSELKKQFIQMNYKFRFTIQ